MTIKIAGKNFQILKQEINTRGETVYFLQGVRGAIYMTMRNIHSGLMFLNAANRIHPLGDKVRLTDKNGSLEVVSQ